YGDSERMLGIATQSLPGAAIYVVTKLSPLPDLHETASEVEVRAQVRASVYQSLHELRLRALPVLLLHRAAQMHQNEGLVWAELKRMKADGLIGKLGVSVQSPAELAAALGQPEVE